MRLEIGFESARTGLIKERHCEFATPSGFPNGDRGRQLAPGQGGVSYTACLERLQFTLHAFDHGDSF